MRGGFIAAALVFVASTGCSRFSSFVSTQTSDLAPQCLVADFPAKIKAAIAVDVCNNSENYVCESQTFSTDEAATRGEEEQCATVSGLGYVCLSIDTATIAATARTPAHTVFHCSNTEVAKPGSFVFQSSAETFEQALAMVVSKCQTGTL